MHNTHSVPQLSLLHATSFLYTKHGYAPIFLALSTVFTSSVSYADESTKIDLPTVAVTGNPLGVASDELIVPVSVLNGRELSLTRAGTLGETLNGTPGVSATSFGPNASRPVIRGLDGERVRIMQNGIGILDASSLSFDHAVSVDPLVIEQIDVVRGPAALLYGGSAVGGVVNAIDHRIPTEPLDGMIGRTEARLGGPDSQSNLAGVIDAGNGKFVVHGDVYSRKTSDLEIPGFAVSRRKSVVDGTPRENKGRLVNSNANNDGGAIGASLTFDNGYLGASYSGFNSNYGTVAEEAVRIDMHSQRWDIASEFNDLNTLGLGFGLINRAKFRLAHTDYAHQELEDGEVGTTFKNRGIEGSLELGHTKIGKLDGIVGFQFQHTHFEAIGDEAFVPSVNTQTQALYLYEELPIEATGNRLKLSIGGRLGHTTVDAKASDVFGPAQHNSFNPNSYALGSLYRLNDHWSLASNVSHNERAPSYFELYANGQHVATNQFEIGNANFEKERANGVDAQIRWKDGKNSLNLGA